MTYFQCALYTSLWMHLSARSFLNKQQIVLPVSLFLHSRAQNESADMFHQNLSVRLWVWASRTPLWGPGAARPLISPPDPDSSRFLFALRVQDSLLQAQFKHCSVSLNLTKAHLLQPSPNPPGPWQPRICSCLLYPEECRETTLLCVTFENCYLSFHLFSNMPDLWTLRGVWRGIRSVVLRPSAPYRWHACTTNNMECDGRIMCNK